MRLAEFLGKELRIEGESALYVVTDVRAPDYLLCKEKDGAGGYEIYCRYHMARPFELELPGWISFNDKENSS